MASLAEQLKKAREDSKLSIKKLSEKTKIQTKYLESLEKEEYDKLPNYVYVKGFVQKWAEACGADKDELLRQFQREYVNPNKKQNEDRVPPIKSPTFVLTSKHLVAVIVIGALVSLAGYFYYNQMLLREAPQLEVHEPQEFNSISRDDSVLIEGYANNLDTVYINDNEVNIDNDGYFEHNYLLNSGLNTIIIEGAIDEEEESQIEVMRKILYLE